MGTPYVVSPPAENGRATILNLQQVGATTYFDAGILLGAQ
jgi:hypothetical protein